MECERDRGVDVSFNWSQAAVGFDSRSLALATGPIGPPPAEGLVGRAFRAEPRLEGRTGPGRAGAGGARGEGETMRDEAVAEGARCGAVRGPSPSPGARGSEDPRTRGGGPGAGPGSRRPEAQDERRRGPPPRCRLPRCPRGGGGAGYQTIRRNQHDFLLFLRPARRREPSHSYAPFFQAQESQFLGARRAREARGSRRLGPLHSAPRRPQVGRA